MDSLARHLDFANHHANSTPDDIIKLCADVTKYGFHAAFVNPTYVALAKKTLSGKAKVGTVVSFPLGQDTVAVKMAIANTAVSDGADELDVVPNLGTFLSGDHEGFRSELTHVVDSARMLGREVIVKFILDPGYFDAPANPRELLAQAAKIIAMSGADYVKIGSGMGPRNPSLDDLRVVHEAVGDRVKIKVAGGISSREVAEQFLAGGAYHLGTSHAIEIVSGKVKKTKASNKSSE